MHLSDTGYEASHFVIIDRENPFRTYFQRNYKVHWSLKSLPDDKYLDWSKLIAFADDKINVN